MDRRTNGPEGGDPAYDGSVVLSAPKLRGAAWLCYDAGRLADHRVPPCPHPDLPADWARLSLDLPRFHEPLSAGDGGGFLTRLADLPSLDAAIFGALDHATPTPGAGCA